MPMVPLRDLMGQEGCETIQKAQIWCGELLVRTSKLLASYLEERRLDPARVAFVAVGSVGRHEGLDASDLDLVPVLDDPDSLRLYEPHDQPIRRVLEGELGIKVSKGEDLTKPVALGTLVAPETIGGDRDDSSALTRRILILTEGQQAGGSFQVESIRSAVLNAYAGAERTRGRHVLSLCNDLARYYRTLCIEYKAKIDIEDKEWATRNMKLRHSRKFWYLSSMLAIVAVARDHPKGEDDYVAHLRKAFAAPPVLRLVTAVGDGHAVLLRPILDSFAWFLNFMSVPQNRENLAKVPHGDRKQLPLFQQLKENSDRMHQGMIDLIYGLVPILRGRVLDWFLL
jgi:hypothetical protein